MKTCINRIKPQVLVAIISLLVLGLAIIILAPDHISDVVSGVITGIGMLAMKVVEDSKDE